MYAFSELMKVGKTIDIRAITKINTFCASQSKKKPCALSYHFMTKLNLITFGFVAATVLIICTIDNFL